MTPPHPSPHDSPHDAARIVRRHTRCIALADETPVDCRFLIDGQSGELVLGVDQALLDAEQVVLCLPDDTFNADATLLIHHRPADEDRWTDRHLAYHPDARPARWARAVVDSAKLRDGDVVDAAHLGLANDLLSVEPALCRRLNADRDRLRSLCRLLVGVEPQDPVAVGVDHLGIDVRARFGIVRVELPSPCRDPAEAERVIDALIRGAA